MEGENEYEMITFDNQCYDVPSRDKPQNPSASENQVPSRDELQNPSAYENLESQYKMPACSWMCAILLVGFILVGSAAFISLGLTLWNNSNLKTQSVEFQASNVAELEKRLAQLQVSVNNNTLECERKIMELQNDSTSELERRLAQLQVSVNNNTLECEKKILELQNSSNDSTSELEGRLAQLQVSVNNNTLECEKKILELQNSSNDSTSELERRLTRLQIIENNRNDIQSNISKSLNFKLNNIIRSLTGQYSNLPADSCSHILLLNLSSSSGHYWIRSSNGSAVRVYCDMTRSCGNITGGWMRVASLDWSNESLPCPDGFRERNDSGIHTCGINSTTSLCRSLIFETYSTLYSRVCGKINAYQVGTPDAFSTMQGRGSNITIDSNYVDGVSLTHGSDPRRHIWTFVVAHDDASKMKLISSICQCVKPGDSRIMVPPSFVGMDYFCDTGSRNRSGVGQFYRDDPLWDGTGCASTSTCCSFNNPPWFHKQLPSATTDDIEMRVCHDEGRGNEDIAISNVEINVQ